MRLKLILSALFSAYLLAFPSRALNAAREAMALWANAVAPALFPFMALLPVLSGEQARSTYARLTGNAMKKLFRLPPDAASSVAVGWIAGSPAGTMAVSRAFRAGALDCREALVAGVLASGCGPVFLVSTVGAAMFGDAAVGARILVSAWTALLLAGFVFSRLAPARETENAKPLDAIETRTSPVRDAVLGTATICGWMMLFGVIADALPKCVYPFLEVSSGCSFAAKLRNAPLAAFLCGFGGVCAMCQNLSALSGCGVRAVDFAAAKLAAGALSAVIYQAAEKQRVSLRCFSADAFRPAAVIGVCAVIPVLLCAARFKRNSQA